MSEIQCRLCGGDLYLSWNLGELYPSAFVESQDGLTKYNTSLYFCKGCELYQIGETPTLDKMYRQYWYKSSLNPSMLRDLKDIVTSVESLVDVEKGDFVVDIGCNVGSLFDFYTEKEITKVGFDPALNLKGEAEKHCNVFINDYFPSKQAPDMAGRAKVVTSIAMFYDVPDPHSFIEAVKNILHLDGLWVIQLTDLLSMLKVNAFDNICHEHIFYYSLNNLHTLLKEHGLYIYKGLYNGVNGGSLRIYVGKKNISNPKVIEMLEFEKDFLWYSKDPIADLKDRISVEMKKMRRLLEHCKASGKTVALLGASTKANTLLQYYNITSEDIQYAGEVNPDKFGLLTPGSNIKIISEDLLLDMKPDYLVLGPWHFIDNILSKFRIQEYIKSGGVLVVPLPEYREYER